MLENKNPTTHFWAQGLSHSVCEGKHWRQMAVLLKLRIQLHANCNLIRPLQVKQVSNNSAFESPYSPALVKYYKDKVNIQV